MHLSRLSRSAPFSVLVRLLGVTALMCAAASCFGPVSMLGVRYSLLLCVWSHCTGTALFNMLLITAPSYIPTRLFGCGALTCSSGALCVSFDAWHQPLAVAVRVHSLHMQLISKWLSRSTLSSVLVQLLGSTALMCSSLHRASDLLLLCSVPATRCCGACAVTAYAALLFISCR
jgi:hypothetical protein